MIRAPVLNTLLGVASSARQLLRRSTAFDEAVDVGAAGTVSLLGLRDVSSSCVWLVSVSRARKAFARALSSSKAEEVEAAVARLGELQRLGVQLGSLGTLRAPLVSSRCQAIARRWYEEAVRQGLEAKLLVPGRTGGVHASTLLSVQVEASAGDLLQQESTQRGRFDQLLQRGLAGTGFLHLNDDDLMGLSEEMKSIWASSLGKQAFWRQATYKVPVGRDAMDKVGSFCQNGATRRRLFEAYFAGFGPEVDAAALDLLRTRQRLARHFGFRSWAEYQLQPLWVGRPAEARRLLDRCWQDGQPGILRTMRRMEELALASLPPGSGSGLRRGGAGGTAGAVPSKKLAHADEAFFRAMVLREADSWKLAEFMPANACLPRLLDVVGRAYGVSFREADQPSFVNRLQSGWHPSVHIYEVLDGWQTQSGRRLGFVYLDLYARQTMLGREACRLAGAELLCAGHAYLSMNLMKPGIGRGKLLNPEEVVAIAHELGHAVHMLCYQGRVQEFDDLPLDVLELPSTLAETIALQPSAVAQYARHRSSGGPPPPELVKSCQRQSHFFVRCLQSTSVSLGLHGEAFEAEAATPQALREQAVASWQKYSLVQAGPGFTPFGEDAGQHVSQGANHIAYLLCYLRVDGLLHANAQAQAQAQAQDRGRGRGRGRGDARWASPDFSTRIRSQLLDRAFDGQRLAALLPPLAQAAPKAPPSHPLPAPPVDASGLFREREVR